MIRAIAEAVILEASCLTASPTRSR
jgi:hypothetical protein